MNLQKIFSRDFDIYLVDAFINQLSNYRRYRYQKKAEAANKNWLKNFGNSDTFIYNPDDSIRLRLYRDSAYSMFIYEGIEQDEILFIKRFLRDGDIFFDIGANIGLYSNLAAQRVGRMGCVYAFEPTPTTFQRLTDNIQLNNAENIKAINAGLSDLTGTMLLKTCIGGMDAWNSFAAHPKIKNLKEVPVKVYSFDDFLSMEKMDLSKIALSKIDVEGWEMQVLKGGKNLFSNKEAPVLLIEFTDENSFSAGYSCNELYDFVRSLGYQWFKYDAARNHLNEQPKKMYYPYENLIAVKDLSKVNNRIKEFKVS